VPGLARRARLVPCPRPPGEGQPAHPAVLNRLPPRSTRGHGAGSRGSPRRGILRRPAGGICMRRIDRMGIALLLGAGLLPCAAAPCQTVSLVRGSWQLATPVGHGARLPDAFSEDVNVPAAARLLRVEQAADGRLLVQFALARDPAAIADEYEAAMTVVGWTRAPVAPFPDARV